MREMLETVDEEKSWRWRGQGDLKVSTEALWCAAQEKAIRMKDVKFHIDKTAESPLCCMRNEKGETVQHILSECKKLVQHEYKRRHDNAAKSVHWKLCEKFHLDRSGMNTPQKDQLRM